MKFPGSGITNTGRGRSRSRSRSDDAGTSDASSTPLSGGNDGNASNMNIGQVIVWIVVGGFAGTLAGRAVTLKKEGLGRWTNLLVGMVGAALGGELLSFSESISGLAS